MKKNFLISMATLLSCGALAGCGSSEKIILIYSASEEERIAFFQEELNKQFPNYKIVIQYTGTGALVSKLQGEGLQTDCDIVYDLEANYSQMLLNDEPNLFFDMKDGYDFSQFKDELLEYGHKKFAPSCLSFGGVALNKKVLQEKGLDVPQTYQDLLDEKYRGLISMPNPKSSGTGYFFYNGIVSQYINDTGDEVLSKQKGVEYFEALSKNVKEFTSSGSAPLKAINRGEVAIGLGMLFQCVQYKKTNTDLDYTYLDYGAPYNLYVSSVINGHEKKQEVKEVWDYLFNTLNKIQVQKLIPDPIYKDMKPDDPDYPTNVKSIKMHGLFDTKYKEELLDLWKI